MRPRVSSSAASDQGAGSSRGPRGAGAPCGPQLRTHVRARAGVPHRVRRAARGGRGRRDADGGAPRRERRGDGPWRWREARSAPGQVRTSRGARAAARPGRIAREGSARQEVGGRRTALGSCWLNSEVWRPARTANSRMRYRLRRAGPRWRPLYVTPSRPQIPTREEHKELRLDRDACRARAQRRGMPWR